MWKDPIVEEVHNAREKLAKEANNDIQESNAIVVPRIKSKVSTKQTGAH